MNCTARLRALITHCLSAPLGLSTSACFYADKLVTLSNGLPQDVYLLAQAYFASNQYRRALVVLKRDDMHERDLCFRHLAARCLAQCKEWEECLSMLGDGSDLDSMDCSVSGGEKAEGELGHTVSLQASIFLLRARAFEMLDNRARAIFWYKQALLRDAYCFEAFAALIEGHMLNAEEELDLVSKLRLNREDRWMQLLLRAKCKKYNLHDQMEGILQELEAPCTSQPQPPSTHHQRAYTHHHQATGPSITQPSCKPHSTQHQPPRQPQQHLFFPEYTKRPVGPITPICMHLDDIAMMPMEPTLVPMEPTLVPMEPTLVPMEPTLVPMEPTLVPMEPTLGQQHHQSFPAAAPNTAPHLPPAIATPGTVDIQERRPGAGGPTSSHAYTSREHNPHAASATPVGTTDAEEGMLLAHVPATPMSTEYWQADETMAFTPEGNPDAATRTGRTSTLAASQQGRIVGCSMPQGDTGGSDMDADMPGIQPMPIRTSLGATTTSIPAANGAVPLSPVPQLQLQGHSQRQQQPGAGSSGRVDVGGCGLRGNVDVAACRADWLYHRRAYEACLNLTGCILDTDPYALQCLTIHLATCVALGRKAELFMRGHKLVEEYPDKAIAWFAVGCYYMCTKQFEQARRHFGKATGLEPNCAAVWIAFGHAFSAQDERDQAMTAYRTASRLFPGLHLAVLGMGMEYSQMGNLQLAERMLLAAHQLCPADPATCHELGVLNYRNGQYAAATAWLHASLNLIPVEHGPHQQGALGTVTAITKLGSKLGSAWEPTVLALGHCLRRQRRWAEALQLYNQALALSPGQPGTFAALGYTHQLMGHLPEAIEAYHSALAIRPDDSFTVDMLNAALEEYSRVDL